MGESSRGTDQDAQLEKVLSRQVIRVFWDIVCKGAFGFQEGRGYESTTANLKGPKKNLLVEKKERPWPKVGGQRRMMLDRAIRTLRGGEGGSEASYSFRGICRPPAKGWAKVGL